MNGQLVPVEYIEGLREALQVGVAHLEAVDIANAYKNLSPETRWSPLTELLREQLTATEGYIQEYVIAQYEEERHSPDRVSDLPPAEPDPRTIEVDLTTEDDDGLAE